MNKEEQNTAKKLVRRAAEESGYIVTDFYANGSFELERLDKDARKHLFLTSFNCNAPSDYLKRILFFSDNSEEDPGLKAFYAGVSKLLREAAY